MSVILSNLFESLNLSIFGILDYINFGDCLGELLENSGECVT